MVFSVNKPYFAVHVLLSARRKRLLGKWIEGQGHLKLRCLSKEYSPEYAVLLPKCFLFFTLSCPTLLSIIQAMLNLVGNCIPAKNTYLGRIRLLNLRSFSLSFHKCAMSVRNQKAMNGTWNNHYLSIEKCSLWK